MSYFKLLIIFSIVACFNVKAQSPKLYCGAFNWTGKFAPDNIWIDDGKFNASIDSNTQDYLRFYNELGLQTWDEGKCICVKGIVEKAPKDYETSGGKQFLFKKITGLFTCKTHVEIKTDMETLKKTGVTLKPYFNENKKLFTKWRLKSDDVLMSVYDKNHKLNSKDSLDKAIKLFSHEKKLKFRVIRNNKVEYVDYGY